MRPTPEDLARGLANKLKGRDVGYQCCLDGSESIGVIVAALADARRAALEEACQIVCWMCRDGYPLQKNGAWHNDKLGKDSMVNNCCMASEIRQRASEGV